MTNEIIIAGEEQPIVPREADTDAQLIDLWLHGRSRHTQRAYRADVERFLRLVGKPLMEVRLADIQAFADALDGGDLEPASRHRILSSLKSLFAFGHRIGYLAFDTARPLKLPGLRDQLSERILDEGQIQRIIALETNPRNSIMLRLLYAAGVRVSELCGLRWRDCQGRDDNDGQISVFGKGDKTRVVLLPSSVFQQLIELRQDASDVQPVFLSRRKRHLHPSQVLRIVRAAAKRAGIEKAVSPHWFRHAHASHALDRGAPISLVQSTLGHSQIATTGRYLHARPSDSSSRYLPL